MMTTLPLRCLCGRVRGEAHDVSPRTGTRIVCHCDDCQKFACWLGTERILDAHGGTDIFQMPPAHVRILAGAEELRCIRLSDKGMYRFYAACCRTPIGNLMGPRVPFVGLIYTFMDHAGDGRSRDAVLGPAAYIQGRFAVGGRPPHVHRAASPALMARVLMRLLGWSFSRKHQPSPFFEAGSGRARAEPQVLSPAERERLGGVIRATQAR